MQHCTPLKTAYEIYRLDLRSRRVTTTTLDFYRWRLTPFLEWCQRNTVENLHELTATHIRSYLIELQERGLADYSQLAAARAIRAFCKFCVREGLLAESPCDKVRMPDIDDRILPAFTVDDIHRLLETAGSERETAIILVLLDTGIRAAELLALNGGDLDLATGSVTVRRGKGRRERTVFMGAKCRKQMLRYFLLRGMPETDEPMFMSKNVDGGRLGRSGLFQAIRRLGRDAGVMPCTPHRFRRTFALWSLRNGMNIYVLARLMGHKDIVVLRRYLALVESDLQAAHERYGAVDNLL